MVAVNEVLKFSSFDSQTKFLHKRREGRLG